MKKVKKPFYKKWWFIAIVIFLIIGLVFSPSEEEKQKAEETNIVKSELKAEEKETKIDEEKAQVLEDEKEKLAKELEEEKAEQEKLAAANKEESITVDKSKHEIDTSVFEYATSVDLTDAIELNNHITLIINMNETTKPGMATQHVVNQAYDFVQQSDVKSAKTIGINVKQGANKIAQFTVYTDKFIPNDDEPMSNAVIAASEIEFMTDEVKGFGKTMDTW